MGYHEEHRAFWIDHQHDRDQASVPGGSRYDAYVRQHATELGCR